MADYRTPQGGSSSSGDNPWGAFQPKPGQHAEGLGGALSNWLGVGSGDPRNRDRNEIRGLGGGVREFGLANQANYQADTAALQQQRQYLQDLANGKNSVSAEQLRQALQQQLAQQRSMAAGANPQNAAMAARNAAMNMGQASYGMSGQQALAGLQERNQANEALAGLNLGARGQDITGTLGGYGAAIGAYGQALGNPQASWGDIIRPAVAGGAAALVASDRNLKTDIKDGEKTASSALEKLRGYSYRYKDERHGKGKQFGPMAQDLEEAGFGHAVIDTPHGKLVHGAKAATTAIGLTAELARRVAKLEGKGKGK